MQKEKLEEIQTSFSRHMEAFRREMAAVVSTSDHEDKRQIQEAITEVLERQSPQRVKGRGAILAELTEATAVRVLNLTDSQKKKDKLITVLTKHLHAQISDVTEILTSDLD